MVVRRGTWPVALIRALSLRLNQVVWLAACCAISTMLAACVSGVGGGDPFSAVAANDADMLRSYLGQGGDVDARSANGESLVFLAAGPHGGEDVLRLLLEYGANPDLGVGAWSPLMNAATWCRPGGISLLLEAGADPMLRNASGQTALDVVCVRGNAREEVIALLGAQNE